MLIRGLVASMAVCAVSTAAPAEELTMIGGFPSNFVFTTEIAEPFMALVEEESGGGLSVSMTGPDAVPTFEQFEPVQAGVFDLLFTHPAYHAGTTPIGLAIDAIAADPKARRDGGIIDFIDDHYAQHGMKLIAAPATGSKGFRFFLKEPVTGEPGLDGRKIRGTVSYHPMIEALGGTGVVIGGGEVYSALQTGVVDGAAWGLTGAKDFKWYEVADYMADPVFGQVGLMIFMNLDSWEALSDEQKATVERAAIRLEAESIAHFDRLAAAEKEALLELGMKTTAFSEAEGARFDSLWSNGVWSIAAKTAPRESEKLRDLARAAGLSQ